MVLHSDTEQSHAINGTLTFSPMALQNWNETQKLVFNGAKFMEMIDQYMWWFIEVKFSSRGGSWCGDIMNIAYIFWMPSPFNLPINRRYKAFQFRNDIFWGLVIACVRTWSLERCVETMGEPTVSFETGYQIIKIHRFICHQFWVQNFVTVQWRKI